MIALAALIFHGLAEEMVWRGYTFARLREGRTFWQAVWLSMPLITATHLPIMLVLPIETGRRNRRTQRRLGTVGEVRADASRP